MANDYYKLPLRLDLIVKGPQARTNPTHTQDLLCSMEESIRNNVYLIITTQFHEARYDPKFGCTIWDDDFHVGNDSIYVLWTDRIEQSIRSGIKQYEKRLERVKVEVTVNRDGGHDAHKRVIIKVYAEIRQSNRRPFEFQREITVAPFISKPGQY